MPPMTSGTKTSNAQGLKCSEMKKWTEEIVSKKGADIKKKRFSFVENVYLAHT